MTDLKFLKDHRCAYYAGMDDKAFPPAESESSDGPSILEHVRYLKTLSLLVDHIAVPPTFIVAALAGHGSGSYFRRQLEDFLQARFVVSAVYSTMSSTKDFVEYKLAEGSEDEKATFASNRREALEVFVSMPLLHRYIPRMSRGFRERLIEHLHEIPAPILEDAVREKLLGRFFSAEARGEVALSREMFVSFLQRENVREPGFSACYRAMNAAYYEEGAATYFANISCLNVEEYSGLGERLFQSRENGIIIGYDPSLFLRVLRLHGVTLRDMDSLRVVDVEILRKTREFRVFKELYFKMCTLMQRILLEGQRLDRRVIKEFKEDLLDSIQRRYHAERKRILRLGFWEDFGLSIILTGLGLALSGGRWEPVAMTLGLLPPVGRATRLSPAEQIMRRIVSGNFAYYLYLEMLEERISLLAGKAGS